MAAFTHIYTHTRELSGKTDPWVWFQVQEPNTGIGKDNSGSWFLSSLLDKGHVPYVPHVSLGWNHLDPLIKKLGGLHMHTFKRFW